MPDLGDACSQINSCESAAGLVMSFPLCPASLFAAMLVLHWDVVVTDWGFFMTGGFDLGLQSEPWQMGSHPRDVISSPSVLCK